MFLLNMPMHTLPYNEHSSTEVQFYNTLILHCQRLISTHVQEHKHITNFNYKHINIEQTITQEQVDGAKNMHYYI